MDINSADATILDTPVVLFPVPEEDVHFNDLVAKPVVDSHQLAKAGIEMGNALGIWVERCRIGKSVIYTIHSIGESKIEAAMEAVKVKDEWVLSQVEGIRFRMATREQGDIARHVVQIMNSDIKVHEGGVK